MRTPEAILNVVAIINPAGNASLQPRDGLTFCNDAITQLTLPLGCAVPIALANQQHDWLTGEPGKAAGWVLVDAETARQRAATGFPTVATWKNPTGGHGHIMLVVPSPDADMGHLYVAGAGVKNFNCARIEDSFGLTIHPDFLTHD
jgi:hypothetical protein